jgi:deoxyribonuclease-4
MWSNTARDPAEIRRFRDAREHLDLAPLVVHDNYLINLAAREPTVRDRSVVAFREEIERSLAIGADYLVFHPGSCKGQTAESAVQVLAQSLHESARGLASRRLMLLIENTAGSGSIIGSRLEELAAIRRAASRGLGFRLGFCLDTAHLLAAGYDIAGEGGLEATLVEIDRWLGLGRVPVIHTNDSRTPLGSRVDRHEHIGRGYIGMQGFRRILNHPRLRDKAFILETPIDQEGDDRRNLLKLKRLCRKSRTITKKSS